MKVSAVAPEHRVVTAPARVFDDQGDFLAAFDRGELDHDHVAVVRHQGPRANGMPELHKLTPGARRADGPRPPRRARHRRPHERRLGQGPGRASTARPRRPRAARCPACVTATSSAWTPRPAGSRSTSTSREREPWLPEHATHGTGRELFAAFRERVGRPDEGASVFAPAFRRGGDA